MREHPLVSVIIPVYNAEKFLHECIESVLRQTYENLQVIIIDDGSKDNSRQIEDVFQNKDKRITLIKKENRGVSSARNIGLQYAQGDYIYFLDADDVLYPNALEKGIAAFCDGIDLVEFAYLQMSETGKILSRLYIEKDYFRLTQREFVESLFYDVTSYPYYYGSLDYQGYLWNKLFRMDIIRNNHIHFNESIVYNEDCLFVLEYMLHANDCAYLGETLYQYRINSNGAMGRASVVNPETVARKCTQLEAYKLCVSILEEKKFDNAFRGALIEGWDKSKGVYLSSFTTCKDLRLLIEKYLIFFGTKLLECEEYTMNTIENVQFVVSHPRIWAYMYKIKKRLKWR